MNEKEEGNFLFAFFCLLLLSDDFLSLLLLRLLLLFTISVCVFCFLAVLESLSVVNNNKNIDNHPANDNVELQNVYKYLKSTGQVKRL